MDERLRDEEGGIGWSVFVQGILERFVCCEECPRRGDSDQDYGANALVETAVKGAVGGAVGIFVDF